MAKQPTLPVTAAWIADVRQRMAETETSSAKLADTIGVTTSAITHLLQGELEFSALVHPISLALGVTPPPTEQTKQQKELIDLFDKLQDTDRSAILELARKLRKK